MDEPGPTKFIRVDQANVLTLVVREIQVISPEWVRHPVWNADQRRPVDV